MNILCPTDYSKRSNHAIEFAVFVANQMSAQLHIVNAYDFVPGASSVDYVRDVIKKTSQEKMGTLITGLSGLIATDLLPMSHIEEGNPLDVIKRYVEENDIDLIIMATQGVNSLKSVLFGSVTKTLLSAVEIPVIVVPKEYLKNLYTHPMVLALDNKEIKELKSFSVVNRLASTFNKLIDIVHISSTDKVDDLPFDPFIVEFLKGNVGEVEVIESDTPLLEIHKYLEKVDAGLLIMIKRNHNMFYNLFLKSHTDQELEYFDVPVMILHDIE